MASDDVSGIAMAMLMLAGRLDVDRFTTVCRSQLAETDDIAGMTTAMFQSVAERYMVMSGADYEAVAEVLKQTAEATAFMAMAEMPIILATFENESGKAPPPPLVARLDKFAADVKAGRIPVPSYTKGAKSDTPEPNVFGVTPKGWIVVRDFNVTPITKDVWPDLGEIAPLVVMAN